VLALAGLQLAVLSSVWPGFPNPGERSRIFAARALVQTGSWQIDQEVAAWGGQEDLAFHEGHYYSDKAPGLIWAAVPAVALRHLVVPGAAPDLDVYLARLTTVTLVALLAAWILAGWVRRTRSWLPAWSAAFLLLFATAFGTYAALFFSHVFCGGLLVAAAWLLLARSPTAPAATLGGLCGGFAVASEYPSAVLVAVIWACGVWGRWRMLPWLVLGALPPAVGLLAYNSACFGDPFAIPYHFELHQAYAELSQRPLAGIGIPSLEGLSGLLISPVAGLLFLAPVLAPALAAPVLAWRRERRLALVLACAVWLQPVLMSGYPNWQGGATFGPRYLVLTLPFWVLGLALVPVSTRWRPVLLGAGAASAFVHLLARLTPPLAINDVWHASTLRGWTLEAMRGGLWNGPPGFQTAEAALGAGLVVVLFWFLLTVAWTRAVSQRRRLRALAWAIMGAVLLAQLAAGVITDRQRRWFDYASPLLVKTTTTPESGPPSAP